MNGKIIGTYGTMYYVRDMERAKKYYKEALELTPRFESPEWSEYDVNGAAVCLHVWTEAKTKPEAGVLILSVTGLNDLISQCKSRGVEFTGEPREVHPGAYSVDFKDLEGNLLSFYEDTTRSKA